MKNLTQAVSGAALFARICFIRRPAESAKVLLAASGAGLIAALMAAIKFGLYWSLPAGIVEAIGSGLNYAFGFLCMQALGFKLATKFPSVAAAHFVSRIKKARTIRIHLTDELAQMSRYLFTSAIGNLLMASVTAVAFNVIWKSITGSHFLGGAEATEVIRSLSAFRVETWVFAGLTGVWLLAGNAVAGAIATRAKRLKQADWAKRGNIAGNMALGLILGIVPFLAKALAVTLEVRHMTFAAGMLGLAACAAPLSNSGDFIGACLGVLLIGGLNFGVSFLLSMICSLHARSLRLRSAFAALGSAGSAFLINPLGFLFPPRVQDSAA